MMDNMTKWLGRTLVAGAAALMVLSAALSVAAHAQGAPEAPPAATSEAPAAPEAPPPAAEPAAAPAAAAAGPKIDTGDTAWMMTSTALVLLMTIPGLALFYGGMVRKKNVLATLAQSFGATCIITVLWMIIGYSLAFTPNPDGAINQVIGGTNYLLLGPMGLNAQNSLAATIPESVYMTFQMTFAIITPALIAGALADRMKFSAFMWFMSLWLIFVYCPIAHWVWGGGFLGQWGALDYAGGTVVHLNAGTAGLITCLVLGKRVGYGHENMSPHNLTLSVIGASLLWVGWFGFNAGSAVTSNVNAGMAMAATQIATAAASLAWMFAEWMVAKKPSVLGMISGAVAGLVAITPASGFVTPGGALIIGLVAGGLCYSATLLRARSRVDDALDVFAVHGVGGMFGAIATGIFASATVQSAYSGLLDGNPQQVVTQGIAVAATVGYAAVGTVVIVKVVDLLLGLRVNPAAEEAGLDISVHGEAAYQV